jgi:hypothetical protein
MSDTAPGAGKSSDDQQPDEAARSRPDPAATILDGLGERREGPRTEVRLACSLTIGAHVHEGLLRDVSPGGAMIHGVRGLLVGDLVRLRVPALGDIGFVAEVRAISLLGVHLAMADGQERHAWAAAVEHLRPGEPAEGSG